MTRLLLAVVLLSQTVSPHATLISLDYDAEQRPIRVEFSKTTPDNFEVCREEGRCVPYKLLKVLLAKEIQP